MTIRNTTMRRTAGLSALAIAAGLLAACGTGGPSAPQSLSLGPDPAITPATPAHCRLLGRIAPLDAAAPPIGFQVNLPLAWNGRSLQYGGGGFNGVLITGLALVPAARFDQPTPLAQGYVTYGTDSGHQNVAGQPPQAFALNDEALENFAHASYKKVRDVAVALMQRAYGQAPRKLYFVGSSEGGREALTMAQRYPRDFDGIFSRVPVINWTGLQHAGTRNGIATFGEGWLRPVQVQRVHEAVLAACDAADGAADRIVSNPVACLQRFDPASLRCAAGTRGDDCLNDAQVQAVRTLRSPWRSPVPLANGIAEYPGWGIGGEATPAFASMGGWNAWWTGSAAPTVPPQPSNGIAWFYGSGALQYFYARDPSLDVRNYRAEDHAARIATVSRLMDSTDPDLGAFSARGGKLLMLEHMADYAQSPFAGIRYHESVVARMGRAEADRFMRLYTAPGVDHVGSGAPANVDMLGVLVDWVERGRAPAGLQLLEQEVQPPFRTVRARPLCEWPLWPRYVGGDVAQAASFQCTR
ncbi:tannase/feruloyl esterase family alpha/beta hydrolase [Variovorax paradoxus]|uniref:tannase/feruloyl esterase family alpha/beta hydrolase n=1 Tax=Variovorax paradoxus TaxID=34073 RepID=UPI0024798143